MTGPLEPENDRALDSARGVYGISVTSDLVGTGVQNLRAYEKAGLLDPSRTSGGTRLYSPDDVARLRRIQRLLHEGLNLAGVGRVLALEEDNDRLRDELRRHGDPADPAVPADPAGPADHDGPTA